MNTAHLNTLVILADRARRAGLIEFSEMAAVTEAVQTASAEIKEQADKDPPTKSKPTKGE